MDHILDVLLKSNLVQLIKKKKKNGFRPKDQLFLKPCFSGIRKKYLKCR